MRRWVLGRSAHVVALALLLVAPAACGVTASEQESTFDHEGVVRLVGVEGGCWVIDVGTERLVPLDLPGELRVDGLAVSFSYETRPDIVSICQLGPIVEITDIEARG